MKLTLTDSRGGESTTLFFVTVAWAVVVIKYLVAGAQLGPLGTQPPMTATEFATACAAVLAIWLGREWGDKGTLKIGAAAKGRGG